MTNQDPINFLADIYDNWCDDQRLPLMDASDLLVADTNGEVYLQDHHKEWIHNFIDLWDIVEQNS
tara:strand:+ start:757 stop:951 length:195 start_codon:yes stop_codon:yes gene_type:complete